MAPFKSKTQRLGSDGNPALKGCRSPICSVYRAVASRKEKLTKLAWVGWSDVDAQDGGRVVIDIDADVYYIYIYVCLYV